MCEQAKSASRARRACAGTPTLNVLYRGGDSPSHVSTYVPGCVDERIETLTYSSYRILIVGLTVLNKAIYCHTVCILFCFLCVKPYIDFYFQSPPGDAGAGALASVVCPQRKTRSYRTAGHQRSDMDTHTITHSQGHENSLLVRHTRTVCLWRARPSYQVPRQSEADSPRDNQAPGPPMHRPSCLLFSTRQTSGQQPS